MNQTFFVKEHESNYFIVGDIIVYDGKLCSVEGVSKNLVSYRRLGFFKSLKYRILKTLKAWGLYD